MDSTFESIPDISNPVVSEQNGIHERLYHAATNISPRRKVGSEEFMENVNPINQNENVNILSINTDLEMQKTKKNSVINAFKLQVNKNKYVYGGLGLIVIIGLIALLS